MVKIDGVEVQSNDLVIRGFIWLAKYVKYNPETNDPSVISNTYGLYLNFFSSQKRSLICP